MMQLCIKHNFIVNFRRRERHTLHSTQYKVPFTRQRATHLLQPHQTTTTVTKIDYNSQKLLKFTKFDYK
jgi:hypothetical protein